jgi:hypothetical protein
VNESENTICGDGQHECRDGVARATQHSQKESPESIFFDDLETQRSLELSVVFSPRSLDDLHGVNPEKITPGICSFTRGTVLSRVCHR